MIKVVVLMISFINSLRFKTKKDGSTTSDKGTTKTTTNIIQAVIIILIYCGKANSCQTISQLDVFLGGCLQNLYISDECKCPVLLSKKAKVSSLKIKHYLDKIGYGDRRLTLNEIRRAG